VATGTESVSPLGAGGHGGSAGFYFPSRKNLLMRDCEGSWTCTSGRSVTHLRRLGNL